MTVKATVMTGIVMVIKDDNDDGGQRDNGQ